MCLESGSQNAPGFRHKQTGGAGHTGLKKRVAFSCISIQGASPQAWPSHAQSPPLCCRYLGSRFKPSSPLFTASFDAVEALVSSSGKAAAPEHTVTVFNRQKRVPYSGLNLRTAFSLEKYERAGPACRQVALAPASRLEAIDCYLGLKGGSHLSFSNINNLKIKNSSAPGRGPPAGRIFIKSLCLAFFSPSPSSSSFSFLPSCLSTERTSLLKQTSHVFRRLSRSGG